MVILTAEADGPEIPAAIEAIVIEGLFLQIFYCLDSFFGAFFFGGYPIRRGKRLKTNRKFCVLSGERGGKNAKGAENSLLYDFLLRPKGLVFPYFYNFFEKWKKKVLCIRKVVCIVNTEIERGSVLDASF